MTGVAVDQILTSEMIKALTEGNLPQFLSTFLIYFFIWKEVRGMKKSVARISETVEKSFAEGENRFQTIERYQMDFEHRLTALEIRNQGGSA